jgi:hypothetical protein
MMVYNIQNYWVFGLCPSSGILSTRTHNVLETRSVSILRWGEETPTLSGPLERANLNHWKTHVSQIQSYFTTGGLPPISLSWLQAPWDPQQNTCCYSPYVTSSLTRGWVCRLQLLLALTSAVTLGSKSRGTHDHILQSQIRDSPNLEGQVPIFTSPRSRVAQFYPHALGSLFVASYDSQGYGRGIWTCFHAINCRRNCKQSCITVGSKCVKWYIHATGCWNTILPFNFL